MDHSHPLEDIRNPHGSLVLSMVLLVLKEWAAQILNLYLKLDLKQGCPNYNPWAGLSPPPEVLCCRQKCQKCSIFTPKHSKNVAKKIKMVQKCSYLAPLFKGSGGGGKMTRNTAQIHVPATMRNMTGLLSCLRCMRSRPWWKKFGHP